MIMTTNCAFQYVIVAQMTIFVPFVTAFVFFFIYYNDAFA
ncbi:hypothetical protein DSUL_40113 [Desulfovibrionales bacterium]